jgi:hypothetical protein
MTLEREWVKLLDDPRRFIRRMYIEDFYNKERELNELLPEQEQWIDALCSEDRNFSICVKPRQVGVTTGSQLFLTWKLLTSSRARRVLQQAHEESAIKRLCRMLRVAHSNLPDEIRPGLAVDNQDESEFAHNSAAFSRSLAGGVGGQARGWTATDLHATEMAKWKGSTSAVSAADGLTADEEAFNSAMNAIHDPTASVIVESTGNGPFGLFYQLYQQAQTDPKWNFIFISWLSVARYADDVSDVDAADILRELDEDEVELMKEYGATVEQIAFRRTRMRSLKMSPLMWDREFPKTPADPFMLFERGWFDLRVLNRMAQFAANTPSLRENELRIFHPWEEGREYFMGVDTSGGVGADHAVISVWRDDLVHVALWAANTVDPEGQAQRVSEVGGLYRRPLTLIEANKYGILVIRRVAQLGGCRLWKDKDGDDFWSEGGRAGDSKRALMTHARELVNGDWVVPRDRATVSQLQNIVEKPNGKIEGRGDAHDDFGIAACLAWYAGRNRFTQDKLATETIRENIRRINRAFGGPNAHRRR